MLDDEGDVMRSGRRGTGRRLRPGERDEWNLSGSGDDRRQDQASQDQRDGRLAHARLPTIKAASVDQAEDDRQPAAVLVIGGRGD